MFTPDPTYPHSTHTRFIPFTPGQSDLVCSLTMVSVPIAQPPSAPPKFTADMHSP